MQRYLRNAIEIFYKVPNEKSVYAIIAPEHIVRKQNSGSDLKMKHCIGGSFWGNN